MPNKCLVTALALGFLAVALSVLPAMRAAHAEQCVTRGTPPLCDPSCDLGEYEKARITGGGCVADGVASKSYQSVCCKIGDVNKGNTSTAPVNPCEGLGPNYDYDKSGKCTKRPKRMKKVDKRTACVNQGLRWNEQTGRCMELKKMGKEYAGPKDKTALRNACNMQNWVWDEKNGRCKKPSQAKADCEGRGSNYRYDLDTGGCVGGMRKGKRKSQAMAEDCEARGSSYRYDFDTGRCVGGMSKGKRKRVDMSGEDADQEFGDEDFQPEKKRKRKRRLEVDIDDLF